jgi:ribosome-associated protein
MTQRDKDETEAPETFAMPDNSPGFLLAERACHHALARKAEDVVILDLRGISDVCDFFVLASGQADVQVRAIAEAVRRGLSKVGQKPVGSEGEAQGRWILLDYVDVVVHVLKPQVREYYQLERLWADARSLVVAPEHLASEGFRQRHPELATSAPATRDEGPAGDDPPSATG